MDSARLGRPRPVTHLRAVTEPAVVEDSPSPERLDWLSAGHWHPEPEATARRGLSFGLQILDRYIIKEMIGPFAIGFVAVLLLLTVNMLYLAADFIFGKGIPINLTLRWLVLQVPALLYLVFPFATLCGVMLGFGRLAGDHELTALRTSGVPMHRIAIPGYVIGLTAFVVAFLVNEHLAPPSERQANVVFRQIAYHSSQPMISPNQIIKTTNGSQQYMLFVGSVDTGTGLMHNVQIFVMQAGYYPIRWTADTARQINGKIVLYNGVEGHTDKLGMVNAQQRFKEMDIPIGDTSALYGGSLTAFEMNSKELKQQVAAEKNSGEDARQDEMVLQEKYAMPAASLIAVFMALPLAARFGRHGRGVGALVTVAAMVVYYLLMAATNAMGKNGIMPTWLAAWSPNILFGSIGLMLLLKEEH
jgi:lipopolysaccharide export system permease protein